MTEYTAEFMAGWERAFEDRDEFGDEFPEEIILNALMQDGDTPNWTAYDQGYLHAVLYWNGGRLNEK